METSTSHTQRNTGIDILRGASILFVILLHINIHFKLRESFLAEFLPKKLFSLLFWNGFYGVIVFFTLSGYLITGSVLKKWGSLSRIDVKGFYWFRFARIIPLLVLLLLTLSVLHLSHADGYIIDTEKTSLLRAIVAVLSFHFNLLEIRVGYLPANWDVLWSISIEEAFYLFFPFVCLFLKNEWRFLILLAILLVVSPWARASLYPDNELSDRGYLACFDAIAIGCAAAIIAHRLSIPKGTALTLMILGWGMIILVTVFRSFVYQSGLADLGLNVTILSLGTGLVLLWLHQRHASGQMKDLPVFRWLKHMGQYSYEIYLSHMFVVIGGLKLYTYVTPAPGWLVPCILLMVLCCYFLGMLLFRYFSEPVNQWLRRKALPTEK